MKFFGIDTRILGSLDIIYYLIDYLDKIERKYKLFIPPKYRDKFYFCVTMNHQPITINYEIDTLCKNITTLVVNANDIVNHEALSQFYHDSYICDEVETIEECKDKLEETLEEDIKQYNKDYIHSYGLLLDYISKDNLIYENNLTGDIVDSLGGDDDDTDDDIVDDPDSDSLDNVSGHDDNTYDNIVDNTGVHDSETTSDYEDSLGGDDFSMEYTSDLNDNETINTKTMISCLFRTNKYIKISLFLKKSEYDYKTGSVRYDNTNLKLINSYFFDEFQKVNKKFNLKDCTPDNSEFINSWFDSYINLKYNSSNSESSQPYRDSFNRINNEMMNLLVTNRNGYYFNMDDIVFMLKLNFDINNFICNDELIDQLPFSKFSKTRFNKIYKYNIKHTKLDKIFKNLNHNLFCDLCKSHIKLTKCFYSSSDAGDICKKCYELKINNFSKRISYLKNTIRLVGRQELFKKELLKTKTFLSGYTIKSLSTLDKNNLAINSFRNVVKTHNPIICRICFGELDLIPSTNQIQTKTPVYEINQGNTNISVGCLCGHMFHSECISHLTNVECPYCRTKTRFTRLFI